jgi:hypothetical protein
MAKAKKTHDRNDVAKSANAKLPAIVKRWLPTGELRGHHWVAPNPKSCGDSVSSLKINLRNGEWRDWTTGDHGGDPVSLAMYLANLSEKMAVGQLAEMLEMENA